MELFPSLKKSLESNISRDFNKERRPIFSSVEYEFSTFVDKINNIDNIDENEIKSIIIRQHGMILNYDLFLASDESRLLAQRLFSNPRFLKIFLDITGFLNLTREEIICINKLAYDYYISFNKNEEVSNLLMNISHQINNVLSIKLSAKLGINGSRLLAIIANSSFKDEKNIHRINTFIVKCDIVFNTQDIIDIYSILFDRFTNLFIFSMMEYKQNGMTKNQISNFDAISTALLDMLDSMITVDIKKVLYEYAYILKTKMPDNVRFSLKSCNYQRILSIIYDIESEYSIFGKLIIP